jgi:hypothetical protein
VLVCVWIFLKYGFAIVARVLRLQVCWRRWCVPAAVKCISAATDWICSSNARICTHRSSWTDNHPIRLCQWHSIVLYRSDILNSLSCDSKFCVAVSGFKLRDPLCEPFFSPPYNTPTLHVLGKTDVVVVEERSRQLVEASAVKRVEEHEGGAYLPHISPIPPQPPGPLIFINDV